jgi:hypothetical protein
LSSPPSNVNPIQIKKISEAMVENYVKAHQEKRALKAHERFSPVERLGLK